MSFINEINIYLPALTALIGVIVAYSKMSSKLARHEHIQMDISTMLKIAMNDLKAIHSDNREFKVRIEHIEREVLHQKKRLEKISDHQTEFFNSYMKGQLHDNNSRY